MATHNKTLHLIASKLGLSDEDKVLRKAAEFERLLQTKSMAGTNMSDTSKVVICLDLAAFMLGVDMDTKTAIKYSGLKPSMYTNCRKVVENLLELSSDKLSVPGVCVKLQCTGVQTLAQDILEGYRKQAKMEIDLNLPQYVCMAVHQACRLNKVKVPKTKLVEMSRLKPAQWGKLETDWTKFADENFTAVKKKRGRAVKNTAVNDEMVIDNKAPKEELGSEPQTESYEDWKRRILKAAYQELRELEESKKQQMKKPKIEKMEEDRRSPRKRSQSRSRKDSDLMSPRKSQDSPRKVSLFSPTKDKGLSIQLTQRVSSRKSSIGLKENLLSPRKEGVLSPMEEDMSPRRSPRKTPQKFSPYKSPSAKSGVRLLFPKNLLDFNKYIDL